MCLCASSLSPLTPQKILAWPRYEVLRVTSLWGWLSQDGCEVVNKLLLSPISPWCSRAAWLMFVSWVLRLLLVSQLRGNIITSHLTDLFGLPELLPQTCSTCLAAAYYSAQPPPTALSCTFMFVSKSHRGTFFEGEGDECLLLPGPPTAQNSGASHGAGVSPSAQSKDKKQLVWWEWVTQFQNMENLLRCFLKPEFGSHKAQEKIKPGCSKKLRWGCRYRLS